MSICSYDFVDKKSRYSQISEEDISKIEDLYNFKFPKVLKDYYKNFNGADIAECPFRKGNLGYSVIEIIPLIKDNYSIATLIELNKTKYGLSSDYIPFAVDEDYEYFYWNKNDGKVYFVPKNNIKHKILISDNINSFFDILNSYKIA